MNAQELIDILQDLPEEEKLFEVRVSLYVGQTNTLYKPRLSTLKSLRSSEHLILLAKDPP